MLSMSIVAMFCLCDAPKASRAGIAERELRKQGAIFSPVGPNFIFLELKPGPRTEAQIAKIHADHAKFAYVVLGSETWKGGREDLKYLRDLPNLRKVNFGPDFPDEWGKELEPLLQLEGLYFGGPFRKRGYAAAP